MNPLERELFCERVAMRVWGLEETKQPPLVYAMRRSLVERVVDVEPPSGNPEERAREAERAAERVREFLLGEMATLGILPDKRGPSPQHRIAAALESIATAQRVLALAAARGVAVDVNAALCRAAAALAGGG